MQKIRNISPKLLIQKGNLEIELERRNLLKLIDDGERKFNESDFLNALKYFEKASKKIGIIFGIKFRIKIVTKRPYQSMILDKTEIEKKIKLTQEKLDQKNLKIINQLLENGKKQKV